MAILARLLPWLVVAQCAGIALADAERVRPDAALTLGALALGVGASTRRAPRARAACALLAAAAAGAFQLGTQLERAAAARPARAFEVSLEARVVEWARTPGGGRLVLAGAANLLRDEPPVPERLVLWLDSAAGGELARALPGDRLRLRARVGPLAGVRNPGALSDERAPARAGLGAGARPLHPAWVERQAGPRTPGAAAAGLRRDLGLRLAALGPGGALLAALALGDRAGLGVEHERAFARLGLAHLLSVSGLHLVLAAGLVYTLARRLLARSAALAVRADPRRLALALALLAAAGYAGLCGGQVPVRRSLFMLAALALAALRARPAARAHPLCAAALLVLAVEPESLFQAGAQLSFAATAALVLAPGRRAEPARLRALADGLRTSATAALATAPLAALRLGSAAPAGLLANLLAVPFTGLLLLPASLLAAVALALAPESVPAQAVARGAERVAAASLAAARAADARLPGAAPGRRPGAGALAASLALSGLGLAARSGAARAAAAFGAGLLLGFGPAAALVPSPPRVVFLDVGQGDATLVQGRHGSLLVDAGRVFGALDRGRDVVLPALGALGVAHLDALLVTHADLDHRGGVPALLDALPVGELWLPFGAGAEPAFRTLREAAVRRGVPVRERGAGSRPARFGDLYVTPLWPPRARPAATPANEASLVVRVEVAGARVLLAGDIGAAGEAALLASGAELRADLLALPHHGSRGSGSAAFLAAVGGVAAVASAPCAGRFGMPHPEVVRRARIAGYTLWWTGRDGAVLAALGPRPWLAGWGAPRCALPAQGSALRGRFSRP